MRRTLISLLDDLRLRGLEKAVVEHRGVRRYPTTCAEIVTIADRFALELMRRSIHFGDRVVLWGTNSAWWVGAMHGCIQRGVIAVPLDSSGSVEFVRRVLDDVKPKLILADVDLLNLLGDTSIPSLCFADLATALPESQGSHIDSSIRPETPVQIVFTSGTTTEPKGIVHTHRNILSSLAPIEKELGKYLRYERHVHPLRFLHTLPLSHVFGQFMGLWIPPLLGAEVHFDERLHSQHIIQTIHNDRISLLIAVPRALQLLRAHLLEEFPQLESELKAAEEISVWARWWRFRKIHALFGFKFWAFVCGGAALPPEIENFWGGLGLAVVQGYGMTESSALITLNHPFNIGRGTIGKVLPGRDVRLTDEGEILVRGPMISNSTWSKGALRPNESEWLSTGDIAQRELSGNLRFVGRKNQVIVTPSGLNVYPEDIEAVLRRQTGVAACAVVAHTIPLGSEPAAVLVFHGSQEEAQQAIVAANAQLAEHQRIRYWKLWPGLDLPRTATGKIQLRPLAAWINQENAGQPPPQLDEEPLVQLLTQITGRKPGAVDDSARLEEDFGLDSLGRVQLMDRLEETRGDSFDDRLLQTAQTLGELRAALGAHSKIEIVTATNTPAGKNIDAAALPAPAQDKPQRKPQSPAQRLKDIYPLWPWMRPVQAIRSLFIEAVLRPFTWFFAAPLTRPAEAQDAPEPMFIISNHVSAYDVPLVLYGLPRAIRRRVAVAMAADMLREWRRRRGEDLILPFITGPLSYWLVTSLINVFPLPHGAGIRRSFDHAGLALDRGFHVLIFPEGRRTEGDLIEFRSGIGLLVQESRAAVLPVALAGLKELVQHRRRWFHTAAVEVRVGKPLRFDPASSPEAITQQLHDAVAALLASPPERT